MTLALFLMILPKVLATIDLNNSELEFLADHLLPEECRKLVAALHFKSYDMPNALQEAEQAVPKDTSCLELLQHWNSAAGEGRGETHEVLEHRLRQMGKAELADWLGRTVFHQLGEDLEDSLKTGLKDLASSTIVREQVGTLVAVVEEEPPEWLPFDTICLALIVGLAILTAILCCYLILSWCKRKCTRKNKRKFTDSEYFQMLEAASDTESEERFDVRKYAA